MVVRRAEDRWVGTPVRKASLAMSGVVVASLLIHAGILFFAATFGWRQAPVPSKETVVELVQEPAPVPKPRETAKETVETPAKNAATPDHAASPEPKPAEPVAAEAKAESKPEPSHPEPSHPEPAHPESFRPEPPKAAEAKPDQPEEAKIAEKEAALQSLKQELDGLKAEQSALEAEARTAAAAEAPAVDKATFATEGAGLGLSGIGTVPPSFSATLPQLSETGGEVSGYEQIVFSQLARTKGVRRHMGFLGTAGILFTVDAAGRLVKATVAHPSGTAELDEEAMQIVTASAPFPKPPPGATLTIAANFNFIAQAAP